MSSTLVETASKRRALQEFILMIAAAGVEQARAMDAVPSITEVLSDLFRYLAVATRGSPNRHWIPDNAHPGFLMSVDDASTMVVPFHLVGNLPSGPALADIRTIAAHLRLGTGSALCLSGSIVLLGDPRLVGDLDFCEYIPLSERAASLDRLAAIANATGAPPLCVTIKLGAAEQLERPWVEAVAVEALDALLGPCLDGGQGKIDVVALQPTTGPVEATNVTLWLPDAQPDDYAAAYSFPYQEIDPGTGATWVPRLLGPVLKVRDGLSLRC